MTQRALVAGWCGLLVLTLTLRSSGQQAGQGITGETAAAIGRWARSVKTHSPGRVDDAVDYVSALTYEDREELNGGMALFLRALLQFPYSTKGGAAEEIAAIAHSTGTPDAAGFLKRAAILHGDVASQGDRVSPAPSTARQTTRRIEEVRIGGGIGRTKLESDDEVPPLLTSNQIILNRDGEVAGQTVASWNWPFARSLLDLLDVDRSERLIAGRSRPQPARDPFVSSWYHATAAQMFSIGAYGDLTPHLKHAALALPIDPMSMFDRGCYAELLGLPLQQALADDLGMKDARAQLIRPDAPGAWTGQSRPPTIPSPARANADAERLFERALSLAPSLAEAHVRLARLVGVRGRHDEAIAHVNAALGNSPAPAVSYFAHLFGGRAAQALGRLDEAAGHYRQARDLYPDAQSVLLASSQLALQNADLESAVSIVAALRERSSAFDEDPWWGYQLCSGRDAPELLRALWDAAPK